MDDRHRKLARQNFWQKHDRRGYECPDCGRLEKDVIQSFEVHHINGEPRDNRPENHIALCRLCHHMREGRKPPMDSIKQLREYSVSTMGRDTTRKKISPTIKDLEPDFDFDVPYEIYLYIESHTRERQYADPFDVWWSAYDRKFGTDEITPAQLMYGLEKYANAEIIYDERHITVDGVEWSDRGYK